MDPRSYLSTFLDESREHIQTMHEGILALDGGVRFDALFSELFRAAHTLKGMSASMGYSMTASVTHHLEEVLGYCRSNPDAIDSVKVDTLLAVTDWLETQLDFIQETSLENSETGEEVISQLQAVLPQKVETSPTLSAATGEAMSLSSSFADLISPLKSAVSECFANAVEVWFYHVSIASSCIMKGARAILVRRVIETFGDILGGAPAADEMQAGEFEHALLFVVAIRSGTGEEMTASLTHVSEVETVNGWRIDEAVLEGYDLDEPSSKFGFGDVKVPQPPSMVDRLRGAHRIQPIVRIAAQNIDMLMNLVSELVIDKNRLENLSAGLRIPELSTLSEHMSRVALDLQHAVLEMRMEPVGTLFQRFPRTVRDLSRRLNKQIEFVCKGAETTCDRIMMDELAEVLVHLIRNAADHGIESPTVREAIGKPAMGTISLTAYTSGQELHIDVTDDGQGIDVDRVLAKAVSSGLIDERTATQMSARQAIELLFESGLSTASQVTDISGRGVGLDVVREKMTTLGGSVHASSEAGKGTTFLLRLPLSLSISRAILVEIDGQTFAVPTASVQEVLAVAQSDLTKIHGNTVLEHDGDLLPIIDASSLLFDKPSTGEWPWRLVILSQNNREVAVAVNRVLGQLDIVHKPLGQYLRNIEWFSGATILGDGEIALIVNVPRWFDEAMPSE